MKTNTSYTSYPRKSFSILNAKNPNIRRLLFLCLCLLLSMGIMNAQWVQVGQDINGTNPQDWMGTTVDITPDGQRMIVSGPGNWHTENMLGYARVYEFYNGYWQALGPEIPGENENDHFGISVSISHNGNRIAVGTVFNDDGAGESSGHVRTFDFNAVDNLWEQVGQDLDGLNSEDYFGTSVSLDSDGTRLAVAGDGHDGNGPLSGHVRIFDFNLDNSRWEQVGQTLLGEAAGDWLGAGGVILSADGSRVAIGAPRNDGINGEDSGHARVFDYNADSNSWDQVGQDIEGEAEWDEATNWGGIGLSMTSDGNRIAIGAKLNNGNGSMSGHARVFDYYPENPEHSMWIQVGQDINGETAWDQSGLSVSLSSNGKRLAVGAPSNDGTGRNAGHVRVYELDEGTNTWEQVWGDIDGASPEDQSGESVVLSEDGTRLVVGARLNDNGTASDAGHVRVYDDLGCASSTQVEYYSDFESDFGFWNDGGNDCDRVSSNANSGIYSIRLRDNSGINSSIYSDSLDLEGISFVTIRFSFVAVSMESGKSFFLEVSTDNGSSYEIYKTWVSVENFRNGRRVNESISINRPFSAATRFRIRNNGFSNNDRIYVDDIVIIACGVDGCPVTGQPCEDTNPCTTGEIFNEDCECVGGIEVDNDMDGYCIGEDPDDDDPCVPNPASELCDNPADTMIVDDISIYKSYAGPNWNAVARITVLDEFGFGVNSASVAVSWAGPKPGNSSGFTNDQGVVGFNSPKTKVDGCFTLTVNSVTKDGWDWDITTSEVTNQICNWPESSNLTRDDDQDHLMRMPLKINPNPFSDRVDITFELKEAGPVLLEIYRIDGQKIRTLRSDVMQPGLHSERWDGLDGGGSTVLNGLYIVRLQMNGLVQNQRVCLLR